MKHYTPPKNKKKLLVTLGAMALCALFGYVESVIPAIFGSLSFAKVQLAILFALFVAVCYSPVEGGLAWGIRCIVYGLCIRNGICLLVELAAGIAAICAVYFLLKCGKFGLLFTTPFYSVCYAIVYCCLYSAVLGNALLLKELASYAAFLTVNAIVVFAPVFVAIKYVPIRWVMDNPEEYDLDV